mgnify:CR=1 FL=1
MIALLIFTFSPKLEAQSFRALQALNTKVEQGGVIIFKIASQYMPPATSNPAIYISGVRYYPNDRGEVFIGVSINTQPRKYIAEFWSNGQRNGWDYEEIEVIEKNFPTRARTPFQSTPRWKKEREVIREVFNSGDFYERYFDGEFIRPLDLIPVDQNRTIGDITPLGSFGIGHDGIDLVTFDPKTGRHQRQIKAVNSGRVALIAKNYSTDGNMVIIDHGSGIFSVYMHLSSFRVRRVGDMVKTGDIIGISGNTGSARRGGAHLHFAMKIRNANRTQDIYVDPLAFIETMNQYFNK